MEQETGPKRTPGRTERILNTYFTLPHTFFCTVNPDGSFSDFNHVFQTAFDYSENELKEMGLLNLIHPEDRDAIQREIDELARDQNRVARNFVNRCRHKDGSYRWMTWNSRFDQETKLLHAIGRDITEDKEKSEKLTTLLETKDKLFSILAHDLRGTLEGIMTMAELLKGEMERIEEGGNESLSHGLSLIVASARSTNELLDNQLNWFFMQLETFKPSFVELDIRSCVKNAIDIYQSMASNKKITLHLSGPSVKLKGDWNMLGIVFRNMISNAIKFTHPEGHIDVDIRETGSQAVIFIEDQGIGMTDDIKAGLFDSKYKTLRAGTHQEPSTGLGLQLCKEIVDMHEGEILVRSEVNKGTTFTVRLPR